MAGDDERDGIAPERLADRPRRAWFTHLGRDFSIGRGEAGADSARRRIHALMKRGHTLQVERDVGEIQRPAG